MKITCPKCGTKDWETVNLCMGCVRQNNGPITLALHECYQESFPPEIAAVWNAAVDAAVACCQEVIDDRRDNPEKYVGGKHKTVPKIVAVQAMASGANSCKARIMQLRKSSEKGGSNA